MYKYYRYSTDIVNVRDLKHFRHNYVIMITIKAVRIVYSKKT